MHEAGLATEIVKIVEQNIDRHAICSRVRVIRLQIGELRQVVPDALSFCFDNMTKGTRLEGARLCIETVRVAGICKKCHQSVEVSATPFACSSCGHAELKIERGFELDVSSFEVDD